jgi:hypothetical protein
MSRQIILAFCLIVLIASVTPADATLYLSPPGLTPPTVPLSPGGKQALNATLNIVPSGPTTFESSNSLQMTTGLLRPVWDVQVIVNGIPAARISNQGDAVFMNGFLLSYSTRSVVAVNIQVQGTVPSAPGTNVMLLNVVQIDSTGGVVPGSTQTVSEPIAGPAPLITIMTTPLPTEATSPPPPATKASGFSVVSCIIAAAICSGILVASGRIRE